MGMPAARASWRIRWAISAGPLGHHDRGRHRLRQVLDGHGQLGGVGDHHVGLRHGVGQAVHRQLPLHLAAAGDHLRIAFEVLHFLAHFLRRHPQVLLVFPPLEAVVQDRQHQQGHADLHARPDEDFRQEQGDLGRRPAR